MDDTAGLQGGWEGVEGSVGEGVEEEGEAGMVREKWWDKMGEFLREGLAEGVRSVDAVGREVRGDGSLVGGRGKEEG